MLVLVASNRPVLTRAIRSSDRSTRYTKAYSTLVSAYSVCQGSSTKVVTPKSTYLRVAIVYTDNNSIIKR
jgi:hypothetical protein